ncbi:MAG: dihydroorotate dehydrogenase [Chloroflexi bacterium]|nr:MAG: dihydroorotate dehydrogenase [Chloroflexota bacterium]
MTDAVSLAVDLGRGLRLRTPVLVASGTFGYGFDAPAADRASLGAIITKGTTPQARPGNDPVRIAEVPSGMLNAIGLQNPGADHVVREYAPLWKTWDVPVIVNVAGDSIDDYATVARRLDGVPGIAGLELNISCPNVANGLQFGVDAQLAAQVTDAVRQASSLPLIVKLTPNVTDIVAIGRAVQSAGADAVSAVNTFVGMAIDVRRRRPILSRGSGGLSGPAIKPLALYAVWQLAEQLSIPVIAIGGIMTADDALEFLLAGAAAVQLGTVNYLRPQAAREVVEGIAGYIEQRGYTRLSQLSLRPAKVMAGV